MKEANQVVILSGGLGTRLQEFTELTPKPMVKIGNYPMLVHIMSIYLRQGFNKFIICGGYKVEVIRNYFDNFQANFFDFRYEFKDVNLATKFFSLNENSGSIMSNVFNTEWEISVIDTGLETTTAGRLKAIENLIEGNEFLCTYGDGVSNICISDLIQHHKLSSAIATVTAVNPPSRYGELSISKNGLVDNFTEKPLGNSRINGGFFVFNKKIYDFLDPSQSLEEGLLSNLTVKGKLNAYLHNGYWQSMDTVRDVKILNDLWKLNKAPWTDIP